MSIKLLLLADRNERLIECWKREFSFAGDVQCKLENIFADRADAIVSPANSFGIMDGGLDGKLRDFFGMEIEKKIRERINKDFNGELLVGQAIITGTGNPQFPYIITAPTMRIPQDISGSINAYLAMKAILITAIKNNISTIVCSGLGSLSGRMKPEIVARQMRIAYEKVIQNKYNFSHWREEREMESYMKCEQDSPPIDLEKPFRSLRG